MHGASGYRRKRAFLIRETCASITKRKPPVFFLSIFGKHLFTENFSSFIVKFIRPILFYFILFRSDNFSSYCHHFQSYRFFQKSENLFLSFQNRMLAQREIYFDPMPISSFFKNLKIFSFPLRDFRR